MIYIGKNGQTIYDVSIAIYGTIEPVFKLLEWNNINLNSDLSGLELYYEPVVFAGFKPVETVEENLKRLVTIKENQSIFDISLQLFGNLESVFKLGNLDTDLTKTTIEYEINKTSVPTYFYDKKINLSTLYVVSEGVVWDGTFIIWDGINILKY